jgi:hypothetical protein
MAKHATPLVRRLEDRRWTALTSSDTATLQELFDDEMAYTHSNALLDSKESYLRSIDTGVVAYTAVLRSVEVVRTFGDTAVVTGRAVIHAEAGGRALQTIARYTAAWARQSGNWQFVSWHATPTTD